MTGVTWMKRKYSSYKRRGRYYSSHNDSYKKTKKVGAKLSALVESDQERVLMISAGGKRQWFWRDKT